MVAYLQVVVVHPGVVEVVLWVQVQVRVQVVHEAEELQVLVVEVEGEVGADQKVGVLWVVQVLSNLEEVVEVSFQVVVVVAFQVVEVLVGVPFQVEEVQVVQHLLVLLVVVALVVLAV